MLTEEITLRLVKEIKRFLLEDALALSRSSDEQLMVRIKEIIDHKLVHYEITPQEREKIARRVFSSLRGLGILDELLNDDSITEIMDPKISLLRRMDRFIGIVGNLKVNSICWTLSSES